jgi:hypothetical protein
VLLELYLYLSLIIGFALRIITPEESIRPANHIRLFNLISTTNRILQPITILGLLLTRQYRFLLAS